MTPEQLQELRLSLPPLDGSAPQTPLIADYLRYYGLEFVSRPGVTHRCGTLPSGPFSLAVHSWQQAGATRNLLLLHGYFDHTGLYGKLVEYGLSRNCNVLIFDLPGHGLSSGDPVAIDDFADYSRAIADVLAAATLPDLPWWVMAQSTGCAALVDFARGHEWPFTHAVLLAPLVRPVSWLKIRLAHRLLQHVTDYVPRTFNNNSSDLAFLRFVREDPLQAHKVSVRWIGALRRWLRTLPEVDLGVGPAMVVQGDRDGTVDWRYNINEILRLFPGSRVEYVAGGGHHLANESRELRERYYQALDDYLTSRGLL